MSSDEFVWTRLWTPLSKDGLSGWVSTLTAAEAVREAFELNKSVFFVSRYKAAMFGHQTDSIDKRFRIRYKDLKDAVVPYDGVPFIIQSRYERECMFGKDKHKAMKDRLYALRQEQAKKNEQIPKRSQRIQNWSKKQGCPAKIIMKEIIRFPTFKLKANTESLRRVTSERLRLALESGAQLAKQHRVYIRLPKDEDHNEAHAAGMSTGLMNPLNEDVYRKLIEIVAGGEKDVKTILSKLRSYVQLELFPDQPLPPKTDVSFYPMYGTVHKHVRMIQMRLNERTLATDCTNFQRQFVTHCEMTTTSGIPMSSSSSNESVLRQPSSSSSLSAAAAACGLDMQIVDSDFIDGSNSDRTRTVDDGNGADQSIEELALLCRSKISSIRKSICSCRDVNTLFQVASILGQAEDRFHREKETTAANNFRTDVVVVNKKTLRKKSSSRKNGIVTLTDQKATADETDRLETTDGGSRGGSYDVSTVDDRDSIIDRCQLMQFDAVDDYDDGGGGMTDDLAGEIQPVIHLLFIDQNSEISSDEQYTELTREQLDSLVCTAGEKPTITSGR